MPFDVQQELERYKMIESAHLEEIRVLKGEIEGLQSENRWQQCAVGSKFAELFARDKWDHYLVFNLKSLPVALGH